MSQSDKPQPDAPKPHVEKQTMKEPQEEFVGDEARPSKDVSEVREKAAANQPEQA